MKKILFILIILVAAFLFWQLFFRDLDIKGNAKLSWKPGNENDIKEYRIYYGTSKRNADCPLGGYDKKVSSGKETNFIVENLQQGETYYFSVTSVNESGKESCFSEEMSKKIEISFLDKIKSILKK